MVKICLSGDEFLISDDDKGLLKADLVPYFESGLAAVVSHAADLGCVDIFANFPCRFSRCEALDDLETLILSISSYYSLSGSTKYCVTSHFHSDGPRSIDSTSLDIVLSFVVAELVFFAETYYC